MEGEEGGRKLGDLSENPLLAQLVIVKMEEIMDKLKLLDYETGFCKKLKFKPFPRQVGLVKGYSYNLCFLHTLLLHLPERERVREKERGRHIYLHCMTLFVIMLLYRHYFALPTNSGEQFFAFTNLAVWLINLNGKKLEQPQEVNCRSLSLSLALSLSPPPPSLRFLLSLSTYTYTLHVHTTSSMHLQYDDPNATITTIITEGKKLVNFYI